MIYEIAQTAQKAVENKCDSYEIYVEESKSIELDSLKDELNFAKEEIDQGIGIRVIKDNKILSVYFLLIFRKIGLID